MERPVLLEVEGVEKGGVDQVSKQHAEQASLL